jgi:ABC-2 type transport system permease protein
MSTIVTSPASPAEYGPERSVDGRGWILVHSLRFEWTKLRTVRSTWWTLLAAIIAILGIAILVSEITVHQWATTTPANRLLFDPLETSVSGAFFAQLAMGVLGVLVITTEYGSGMIRSTFAAVPQRGILLTAKALVLFAVTLIVGITASFVAFFTTQAILATNSEASLGVSITDPGAVQTILGSGLFLGLMALLGCAVGALLRRSAGAITTLFGLTFLLPVLMQLLPAAIKDNATRYLPTEAGSAIYRHVQQHNALSPAAGLLVLCSYALLGLAVATVTVRRRDA